MSSLVVAFSGPSNSGKTTTILKVSEFFQQDSKVSIIKHDPADKAVFDTSGKDSDKFYKGGADVVVASPTRTTYFSREYMDVEDMIKMLNPFDVLLIEGLKTLPYPRISIFRDKIDESYLPFSDAIAIDNSVDIKAYDIPKSIDVLDLNNIEAMCEWIKQNAKKIQR